MSYKLLSFNNPKVLKGEKISNYLTAIMHLSPINTKIPTRKVEQHKNYHLTWSYSEANMKYANLFDKIAYNIAVVFNGDMPIYFKGREVVNGDESDLRFLDKSNVIVGLKAKGKARKDTSGFVIQTA